MRVILLDLETTGFPKQIGYDKYYPYQQVNNYDSSRIVQIACIVCEIDFDKIEKSNKAESKKIENNKVETTTILSKNTKKLMEEKECFKMTFEEKITNYEFVRLIEKHNYIIKPEDFNIKNSNIHGITHDMALFTGISFVEAILNIRNIFLTCEVIIAHNIIFDKNILLSELYRIGDDTLIKHINSISYFCTSKGCSNITKIPFNSTKFKQPKLTELYKYLFETDIEHGLHDACYDIENTTLCLLKLVKNGYLNEFSIRNWTM